LGGGGSGPDRGRVLDHLIVLGGDQVPADRPGQRGFQPRPGAGLAGGRAARLLERRAKVLGTDAPRRTVATVLDIPVADLAAAAEVLRQELGLPAGDGAEVSPKMLSGSA